MNYELAFDVLLGLIAFVCLVRFAGLFIGFKKRIP
jgi:hypothetical protein